MYVCKREVWLVLCSRLWPEWRLGWQRVNAWLCVVQGVDGAVVGFGGGGNGGQERGLRDPFTTGCKSEWDPVVRAE